MATTTTLAVHEYVIEKPPPPPPIAAPPLDIDKAYVAWSGRGGGRGNGGGVDSVMRRSRREGFIDKAPLALRSLAALFSLIALVLMASNKHGDWMNFDRYEEYRYLVAISAVSFVYSIMQALRHASRMRGGYDLFSVNTAGFIDFAGDQIFAYLLISALSAAIPITDRMRSAVINTFTNATAASISMAFFAFLAHALSSLVSGYKLYKQTTYM